MTASDAYQRAGRRVVMLCTAGRGGMRAVVEGYQRDGVFDHFDVVWLVTHVEGSLAARLTAAARAYLALLNLLLRGRVAAVHSHMAMRGSFWRKSIFNMTARAFGVPVVAHLHGSEFKVFYANQAAWRQRRISSEFERCSRVLVLSPGWAVFVQSIAPGARVTVLPNYVRMPDVVPARAAGAGVGVRFLFLGLVGQRKGVYDLLPAFARALADNPTLRLLIGGNGEVERARALAESLKIADAVDFLGWLSGQSKVEALRAADVYVLPSHNEGLPVSVLEAMSYGLPVISTRVGGIPELVRDQFDGLLVNAGDVDALAAAISRLARNPALRREWGDSARARVTEHYSDRVILPGLFAVYDELLHPPGRVDSVVSQRKES